MQAWQIPVLRTPISRRWPQRGQSTTGARRLLHFPQSGPSSAIRSAARISPQPTHLCRGRRLRVLRWQQALQTGLPSSSRALILRVMPQREHGSARAFLRQFSHQALSSV
ncbi:hypothetical protein ADK38_14460 [Streptomyces varsoviensis]|uniref:Uncharacterized protein n=1 Tax=Streptomyces varsoviensis TaxID=67373 RepID=A0ABR5J7J4_9ACTN|nr:hypothetical protein ADK38_14460 [Streptomyces varsoviensis]